MNNNYFSNGYKSLLKYSSNQKSLPCARSESGRSLVEMLGTLAVMGVLTIGGIAGYRYAINKSNANTILNAVSQMAVIASTELTMQGNLTLPEWKDASGNLSISGTYGVTTAQNNDGTFSIIVSNMNDEVCDQIKGMDWKVPEDIIINGESDSCDQGEANTIEFVFNNTLGKKNSGENRDDLQSCSLQTDCPYCHTCTGGKCVPDALCDNSCPPDKPVLTTDGSCISCPSSQKGERLEFLADNANECEKCGFPVYSGGTCRQNVCPIGYWLSYWNTCMNCDDFWSGAWKTCESACPNRTQTGRAGSSYGKCKLNARTCVSGEGKDSNGNCYPCGIETGVESSSSSCTCSNMDWARFGTNDICFPICPNGWTRDNQRCCSEDEVFIQQGSGIYRGGKYGRCCPKTRPNWNGSKCMP